LAQRSIQTRRRAHVIEVKYQKREEGGSQVDDLVLALGPVFAAGFAVQQLLEILDPLVIKIIGKGDKKLILGLVSLAVGLALAFGSGLSVLRPLKLADAGWVDAVVTGLILSAGTEGINSILKYLGYSKDKKRTEKKVAEANARAEAEAGRLKIDLLAR